MHLSKKAQHRAQWMQEFEDMVITMQPKYTGKIEWNDAVYMYDNGYSTNTAANRYIKNREDTA